MSQIEITSYPKESIYQRLYQDAHAGAYISYLRGRRCQTECDFFHEVSASFQFPYYFGENWNAFDDCICDLDWISFTKIVIVIDDFSYLFNGDIIRQDILLKHLKNMIDYWTTKGITVDVCLNN